MKNRLSSLIRRLAGPAQTAGSASEPATTEQPLHTGDIAIIGMACRVPGAGDYHRFWENLASVRDSVTEIPPSRWDWRAVWGDATTEIDKSHARHAGCIDDVEAFDARFFGIAPASARIMDPQQRIMLELSWACLEDAGVVPSSLAGSRTGVFVAAFNHDYKQLLESAGLPIDAHHSTGNAAAVIANRISHFYDLHGPSVLVDTACSGSLSAIHQAVQSLRLGETELALAGGVNLLLTPDRHIAFAKTGMLSPTGACKSFDEAADGYVRSEGAGLLLLKHMAKALADGDPIHGVIKGSAVNHSGKTHTLTYPSSAAQAQVIEQALGDAKVLASSVSYVEAHGTGTPKGDPIEIQGLRQAFCPHASDPQTCGLGSAKSNIGHLEAAAGVAGVIKVLLSFKAGQLAPLCHFSTLSSRIDLHGSPFYPVTRLQPWQPASGVRRAGVSSFGFGGTNGHLILEEPPARAKVAEPARPGWLIALSAKTPASLRGQCRALHDWLQGDGAQVSLAQLSQALLTGREHLACRQAWVVGGHDALMEQLLAASQTEVQASEVDEQHAQARQLDAARLIDTLSTLAQEPSTYLTQLQALAKHYRCAVPIAFTRLFSGQPRRHLGVPGYAFARDRFWLPTRQADLLEYRLQRNDPCIRDHVIAGQHRVAGAVTLAVAARAWGALPGTGWRASQVAWLQALDVSPQGASLHVILRPTRADATDFEVCVDGLAHPLCSGTLAPHHGEETQRDLRALRRGHPDPWLAGEALYDQLRNVGMPYGPTYRALQHCHVQGDQSLLALAVVPAGAANTLPFSPVALDAAFQAAVLLAVRRSGEHARLGFSVGQLHLSARLPERCWVHVTSAAADAQQCRFDIEWIAKDGRVCAVAKDFVLKAAPARAEAPPKAQVHSVQWCALEPVEDVFVEQQRRTLVICADPVQAQAWSNESAQTGVLVGAVEWGAEQWRAALENAGAFERLVWLAPVPSGEAWCAQTVIEAQEHGVMALFALCQGLLKWRKREHALQLLVVTRQALQVIPGELHDPTHAPVHGLAGTLANECPAWQVRMVDLPLAPMEAPVPLAPLTALPPGASAAWREGQWYRQVLLKVDYPLAPPVYRKGGCYVIVGGAGGIGVAWTQRLIADYQAQVYWIGRRPLDTSIRADIERLASEGPAPIYLSADARDPQALRDALAWVQGRHDQVHGVIHAAMVMRGKSIERMSREEFGQVLAAKVDTGAALAEALQGLPLDFLVFFSSINAFERSPNQSNYAAGCCFIDELGAYLAQRLACPVAVLDWGYWEDAGALAGSPALEVLRERTGAGLIGLSAAMGVVDLALSRPWPRLAGTGQRARAPLALECPQQMISLMPRETEPAADMLTSFATAIEGRGSLQLRGGLMLESWHSLLCQVLLVQLQAAGLFDQLAPQTTEALYQRLQESCAGAVGVDRRWLAHSLRWLAEEGWLAAEGDSWRVQREVDADSAWAAWDNAVHEAEADVDRRAQAQLVDACLRALPAVLGGRLRATEVMFPEGSMARVEGIYKHNAVSDYFNEVITQAVLARVRAGQQAGAAPVRILEIGAGTGGTSARVLEGLDTLGIEVGQYAYTDLSRAFLMHAQAAYGEGRPYLDYRILDVEKDLVQQGLALGSYDLVIATNVLHATADIRQVVEHAKAALKTDGWLLLNELSQASLFSHLTFGLLEGWWRYRDEALRLPGTPGLSSERWQQVLEEAGYRAVLFPCRAFHGLGQQVVMACSDGVVRVPRRASLPASPKVALATRPAAAAQHSVAASAAPADRFAQVRQEVMASVAKALKVALEVIDPQESFSDYGLDSITGVNLVRVLNERLGIDLGTTALFDFSTATRLARHIVEHYDAQLPQPAVERAAPAAVTPLTVPAPVASLPAVAPAPKVQAPESFVREPIAIIGMSGQFPGSQSLEQLWEHLSQGRDLTTPVERWDLGRTQTDVSGKGLCRRGGLLTRIDEFDASFFNISGLEATCMDPQQRLFLEQAWTALEDAGYVGQATQGRPVGVYVGASAGDYRSLFAEAAPAQAFWGNASSIIPARIAYHLDLQGPAIAVDTACSSSLVAIHLACQALWTEEIDMALAGGVFVQSTAGFYQAAQTAGMLSPSGHCHAFDARADGFVPAEGVGVLILKRLRQAQADGDHIHAVISGIGSNQDGASNGITAPSAQSQERLIRQVHREFAIEPGTISLVEAHGTGTPLGDPIEFEGLTRAFARPGQQQSYCALGSIKSNLGHCVTAAGVAGVLKVALALRHGQLPPAAGFSQANAAIALEGSPFYVPNHLSPWVPPAGVPRRASVSSFGFSGTNAHLVMEQAPAPLQRGAPGTGPWLVVLSARSAEQLREQASNLVAHCVAGQRLDIAAMAYTLMAGRKHHEWRLALVANDVGQVQRSLENWLHGRDEATVQDGHWDVRRFVEQQEVLQAAREGLIRLVGNHDQQVRKETLAALAQAFVQGYEVDYNSLFIVDERRRVPLPTYPFLRQSYWVSSPKVDKPTAAPLQASAAEEVASQWLFCQEQWQARDLPGDLDWSACIKARAGARVAVVTRDRARFDAFSQLLSELWSQAGSPPPSVQRLLPDALPAQEALPEVVFFIGDEAGNQASAQPGGLDTIKQMLQVSRYLMATDWEHAVECFHVYRATGSGSDCDAQAISGFAASASLENARHGWTLLECEAGAGLASDVQLIVREWLAGDRQGSAPTIVKYQGTQRLRRLLAQREAVQGQAPRFRREGHYLVVGGLGPVGELLCQELAGTFQARLSIVSRSALDAEQRERCDVLRALGATVDYSSVDITDLSALQHVVGRRVKAAGPLQGVIHLARLVDDGLIVDKPWEVFERSIGAKVKGTINLDLATADQPLAFFTVFSSMAAYGIRGSADYGYAAAFQNAFMRYRQTLERQGKRHGVSIACAWGAWCVDRYMPANRPAHLQSLGLGLIDIRAAFDYLHTGTEAGVVGAMKVVDPALACAGLGIEPLQSPSIQCAGDDIGLHAQLQAWEQACAAGAAPDATQWCNVLSRYELDALDEATIDRLDRLFFPGEAQSAPVDVGAPLLQVREVIARVLVVDEPDLDTAFSRYGMDSVGAMQVASALSRALGRLVEPRWLVQHATIRALAEFLHSQNEAATQ